MDLSKSIPTFLEVTNESKPKVAPLPLSTATDHFAQSVQIALGVANAEFTNDSRADAHPPLSTVVVDDNQFEDGGPPQDLTITQITEAMELVGAVADGRDPMTSEKYLGDLPDAIVKALCIAVAYLAEQRQLKPEATPVPIASGARGALALQDYLDELERREIVLAIESAKYNKTLAAKILGITFRSLRYRLDRLGIK